ncbi:MAG: SRPBCC family protein [Thalassovita sp.]
MATVVKVGVVAKPASEIWAALSDVDNVSNLSGMIAESRMEGDLRICVLGDGSEIKETILSVDSDLMRVAYRVHESPLPIEEHAASYVVTAEGDDSCRVTWITDLKPDAAAEGFSQLADPMFADLLGTLQGETENA